MEESPSFLKTASRAEIVRVGSIIKVLGHNYQLDYRDNVAECVVKNRLSFVEEFGIAKSLRLPFLSIPNFFDHTDHYRMGDGRTILVSSPYRKSEEFDKLGFSVYAPLYNEVATTYYKIFDDHWAARKLFKPMKLSRWNVRLVYERHE